MSTPPALSLRALRKAYGRVVAVDGLDLEVRSGECFGLLGPNGAGKTTTIEICEGLTAADSGDVLVLGRGWRDDATWLRQRLGIQLQETQFAEKLTVRETVRLFRSFYARGRTVDDMLALVSLGEKRDARVGGLSGGQKQRLALACALVGDPDLVFLDEPTTGLDPQSRRQLWELVEGLRADGRTIVLTTHYMEEAERLCDRVAIVDRGRVIALGTPRELVASLEAEQMVTATVRGIAPDEDARERWLATVCALPGVLGARAMATDDGEVATELRAATVAAVLPPLLAAIEGRGLALAALATHAPTLEDVFVARTGRALRDG
jgi:ABC-2 type transport system ATP-binding protein